NDIRNGAGPSGGGGGDAIRPGIHVWIERFTKLKSLAFRSAATPDRGYDSKRQDFQGQDQRSDGRNENDRQGQ
nr:hypothetical protein [Tanacetum cinerariifolium]